ncbi:RND family efflux transporter MFP subunit [Motilibacter peucedani]|uniref:RND family efflux transporter MFP subunit n=1 Tax=Motilibacter peucedani TaxID=598650 RepID=A0A420XPN7_9ACTN|nr:efflux RND transporter periplasmic adaptor subunit [Motilibacter peucedani]RKS75229.1 RND family efflux transporter MFP subunit [Motilibacter peucedani]
MSRGKRRAAVLAVPLAAVVLVGAAAWAVTSGGDETSPTLATVGRATVREVVEAPGQVVARAAVTVTSPAQGTVAELRVADGARVEQGQVLLRIDSPTARARLEQARQADAQLARSTPGAVDLRAPASVQRQAAATAKAAADGFASARAAAEAIPDPAARAQALATVTSAESQFAVAQQAAQDSLDRLNAGASSLTSAAAALVDAQRLQTRAAIAVAQSTVDSLVVRAPVAGVVTFGAAGAGSGTSGLDDALSALPSGLAGQASDLLGSAAGAVAGGSSGGAGTPVIAEGLPVSSGASLLTVTDDSDVSLSAEVDETDILLVQRGTRAGVELDAVPGTTYQASVTSVEANPASSAAGSVSYRVRLRLGDAVTPDGSDAPTPRPGMSAVVDLRVRTAKDAVSVPAAAVFKVGDRDAVWVAEGHELRRRMVSLGAQGEDLVQVVSGVEAGERVVVSGADRVHDGQHVA